jgi:hypothetical protein
VLPSRVDVLCRNLVDSGTRVVDEYRLLCRRCSEEYRGEHAKKQNETHKASIAVERRIIQKISVQIRISFSCRRTARPCVAAACTAYAAFAISISGLYPVI